MPRNDQNFGFSKIELAIERAANVILKVAGVVFLVITLLKLFKVEISSL